MKQFVMLSAGLLIMVSSISCNAQGTKKVIEQNSISSNVSVYYFHFTRRCATCMAVEENAKKAVEALYPDKVKTGEYSFTAINLDDTGSKEIAKKLSVGGQTLLVVRGDKKIDITSAAWLSAHDPDRMKVEIRSGIEKVLF